MIQITFERPPSGETGNLKDKGARMNSTVLLKKLIEIERSIGTANNLTLRDQLHDAQDYLLGMQKETADRLLARCWRDVTP